MGHGPASPPAHPSLCHASQHHGMEWRSIHIGWISGTISLGGEAIVMIGFRSRVLGDLVSPAIAGSNPARCVFLIYATLPLLRRNSSVQSWYLLLS
jgi:hypothetical protein